MDCLIYVKMKILKSQELDFLNKRTRGLVADLFIGMNEAADWPKVQFCRAPNACLDGQNQLMGVRKYYFQAIYNILPSVQENIDLFSARPAIHVEKSPQRMHLLLRCKALGVSCVTNCKQARACELPISDGSNTATVRVMHFASCAIESLL